VPLQEKRPIRCLPGHILKELGCLLASMVGSALWLQIRFPQHCPKPYEDHHGTAGQTHLDSTAFQSWSHKLEPEARMNQAAHSHTHSHRICYSYPSPLLGKSLTCRTPLRSSQELIKLPFHPVGRDLTEGWLSWGGEGGLPSPDEISRWVGPLLLGVQSCQDYSEGWNSGAKEDLEYHWLAHHFIRSLVPPYSSTVQPLAGGSRGQNACYLTGASRNVEILLATLREVEN
jgi:hypothetical protein